MAAVQVTGDEALRATLRGMGLAARNLTPVLDRQARRTADAIAGVPRGATGRLAKSIKGPANRRVTADSFEIGMGIFYGHVVFGGTQHSRPAPPTIPAGVARETARLIGAHIVREGRRLA